MCVSHTTGKSTIMPVRRYTCDVCTASCMFEAMQMCAQRDFCPVIIKLESGEIVDRRPTDNDPEFPSEFSYAEPR